MRLTQLFLISVILVACSGRTADWESLLDKNLSQWDSYLSYQFKEDYNGEQPKDDLGNDLAPIGENSDSHGVFSIVNDGNETVLKISGEIYGALTTKREFENYHLRLKVRWGDKVYPPRENLLKDSGIMYHAIGPNGVGHWRSWMQSHEFQIMEGHMGDYWAAFNEMDIRAYPPEGMMSSVADNSQPFHPAGSGKKLNMYCMRSANYENPPDEWNTLELICYEDKSLHIVNGEVVMVLRDSRYFKNGSKVPVTKGKIQLQSEGAEVFIKDIEIRNIELLPPEYVEYYN